MSRPVPTRRALLAATSVLAGGGLLASISSSVAGDSRVEADTDSVGWPAYHGRSGNTGFVPVEPGPEPPVELAWRYEHTGSTAVVDDIVYLQAGNGVHAIDAADGSVRWITDDIDAVGGLSVASDTVYVGGERLTALDAETGDVRWFVEESVPEPAVAHGLVFTVVDSTLTGFDAETGVERWTFTPDEEALFEDTSVAVADETVFVVSPSYIFARRAIDGSERWTYDSGDTDDGTGSRFEGAAPHRLAANDEYVAVPEFSDGGIDRIGLYDIEIGDRLWRTTGGVEGVRRVTITDDRLYVQGWYATGGVDLQTGETEWFAATDSGTDAGLPVATADAVYVGRRDEETDEHVLSAFDEDGDSELWTVEYDDVDWFRDSDGPIHWEELAIADGTLYASGIPSGPGRGLAAFRTTDSDETDDDGDADDGDESDKGDADDGDEDDDASGSTDGDSCPDETDDDNETDDEDSGGCPGNNDTDDSERTNRSESDGTDGSTNETTDDTDEGANETAESAAQTTDDGMPGFTAGASVVSGIIGLEWLRRQTAEDDSSE
ncbi:PQQ-binding-like beta-propeller repeat protein [Natronosalvus vescus]|uniref:outer membrane protein assembly factor BamB family protein n=1 Tax=Natronosalvus vescus TaxID=2953881 RepID=UPI002090B823|nr:PQQ-binding-like beta-propeller repeat protein [Natronosalvus vescus]